MLLDGTAANSSLVLASKVNNRSVVIIDVLGEPRKLHPLQEAFIQNNPFSVASAHLACFSQQELCLMKNLIQALRMQKELYPETFVDALVIHDHKSRYGCSRRNFCM